jgi:hypothetical protein
MPLSPSISANHIKINSRETVEDENTPLLKDYRSFGTASDVPVSVCQDEEDFISIASTLVDKEDPLQSQKVVGVISVLLLGMYCRFLVDM